MPFLILPVLIAFAGIAVMSVTAFVLAAQIRFHVFRWRHGEPSLTLGALLWAPVRELYATFKIGWYWLRTRIAWSPGRCELPHEDGVLFVHGYTQNDTNWWGMRHALARAGHRTRAVSMGFPWPWKRVAGYAAVLERALERRPVHIVAHSMGGVVLREVLNRRPDLRAHVLSVVTLGSPHGGTAVTTGFTWLHPVSDIARGSSFLQALPTLGELLPGRPLLTVGGSADMIVYPHETSRQPGVEHLHLEGVGHAGLLSHPRAIDAVVSAVRA